MKMPLDSLLLHPKTRSSLQDYLDAPTQVLALIAPEGAGKRHIALTLVSSLLDKQDLTNESRLITVERQDDKKEIAIGAVRELIKTLRLKQSGNPRRIVCIYEAEKLSHEAQNALLKTLEQPNPDTLFILSVSDTSRILPTVLSRTQKVVVYPVGQADALAFYGQKYTASDIKTAWLLGEGYVGQLHAILEDEGDQPLKSAVEAAKNFLSKSKYERLVDVDPLSKDREQLLNLLSGLSRILKSLHHSNIKAGQTKVAIRLMNARKLVSESQRALAANASAKIVLLKLIVNLQV